MFFVSLAHNITHSVPLAALHFLLENARSNIFLFGEFSVNYLGLGESRNSTGN